MPRDWLFHNVLGGLSMRLLLCPIHSHSINHRQGGKSQQRSAFLHSQSEGLVVSVGTENVQSLSWPWCGKEQQMATKVS